MRHVLRKRTSRPVGLLLMAFCSGVFDGFEPFSPVPLAKLLPDQSLANRY